MPRPLRLEFPGAVYHVTSRGDRREEIYRDDMDRRTHLGLIAQSVERFDARMLAYCLMGNHYHLVLQTREANLSRLMRQINGVYTQAFNRRHALVGHLFQGRFKAILVDHDAYLMALCRYVERNPVAAGLVAQARDWPWSSCTAHLGESRPPAWLDVDMVYAQLLGRPVNSAADRRRAQQRYAELVEARPSAAVQGSAFEWKKALHAQVFLGDEAFVSRVQARLDTARSGEAEGPGQQQQRRPSLQDCLAQSSDRDAAIAMAFRAGGLTMTAIARELGLSVSRVSRIVAAVEAKGKS